MIFIVRTAEGQAGPQALRVVATRVFPSSSATAPRQIDYFAVDVAERAQSLINEGWTVIPLTDGWYANEKGGGVAVWAAARHWEVRDSPFYRGPVIGARSATQHGYGRG